MTHRFRSLFPALFDVHEFHVAAERLTNLSGPPAVPSHEQALLRARLITEEAQETLDAIAAEDLVAVADGLADLIYVALGTALAYGIPLDLVWDAVHRSNMAKIDPATGRALLRADGKVLKPPGWTPPDIASILQKAGADV